MNYFQVVLNIIMTKHLLLSLSFLCLCIGTTVAQQLYTVQVGTFVDSRPQNFDEVRQLGFIYEQSFDGGLQRVFLGRFTTQAKAQQFIAPLQNQGFTNATVQPIAIQGNQQAIVIQIATRYTNKSINWSDLQRVGSLNVALENELIKVTTGTFSDLASAKNALPDIQRLGYKDAFVKTLDSWKLIPVTAFSTGQKQDLIPLNLTNTPPPPNTTPLSTNPEPVITTTPQVPSVPQPNVPTQPALPDNFETAVTPPPGAIGVRGTTAPTRTAALPEITGNIKRNSVIELQRVLKEKGYYQSSLDGYYGNGTASAYAQLIANDEPIKRYQHLATGIGSSGAKDALQTAIDNLPNDANAPLVIEQQQHGMAKAYQAYQLFLALGSNTQSNQLMNAANRAVFQNTPRNQAPFDYQATYAYQDMQQLIQHLYYLHTASSHNYQAPCWLAERHPNETIIAKRVMGGAASQIRQGNCVNLVDWPSIQLLQGLALHVGGSAAVDAGTMQLAQNRRHQILQRERGLDLVQTTTLDAWQKSLWNNLDRWGNSDIYLQETTSTLKIAYFQSQVLLEDYFMDKGFATNDAKGLAMAVLQTIVEAPLARFF